MPIHPMAEYLGEIKDKEELKIRLKQQKKLEKQTINSIKNYLKSEHIKPLEWQNAPQIEMKSEQTITLNTGKTIENSEDRPIFESRFERYEWHLKNGFDNDSDFVWFKQYELSDEYKQIYGNTANEK